MKCSILLSPGNNLANIFFIHTKLITTGHTKQHINSQPQFTRNPLQMLQMLQRFYCIYTLSTVCFKYISDIRRIFIYT